MKKVFLAIATLAMSVAVNAAVLFDLTDNSGKAWADGGTLTNATLSAEVDDASEWKDYLLQNTAEMDGILTNGQVAISYKNSSSKTGWKIYKNYVQTNGSDRKITISGLAVGEVVNLTITTTAASSIEVESGATASESNPDLSAAAVTEQIFTFTATDATIVLNCGNKFRVLKIATGATSGVENASADAKEVKYFNVNGQEVAADAEGFVFGNDGSKKFNK